MSSTIATRSMRRSASGRRRRALTGIALSAGLLFAGACGSDDDGGDSEGGSASAAGEDAGPPDDDAPEPDSPDLELRRSYCSLVEEMGTDALSGAAATDPDAAAGLVGSFREISESAPDDVAADWTALADAMELMSDIDYSDPDALAELEELEDLTEVNQRIQDSVQSECA